MARPDAAPLALALGLLAAVLASTAHCALVVASKEALRSELLPSGGEEHLVLQVHVDLRDTRDSADPIFSGLLDDAAEYGRLKSLRVRRRSLRTEVCVMCRAALANDVAIVSPASGSSGQFGREARSRCRPVKWIKSG